MRQGLKIPKIVLHNFLTSPLWYKQVHCSDPICITSQCLNGSNLRLIFQWFVFKGKTGVLFKWEMDPISLERERERERYHYTQWYILLLIRALQIEKTSWVQQKFSLYVQRVGPWKIRFLFVLCYIKSNYKNLEELLLLLCTKSVAYGQNFQMNGFTFFLPFGPNKHHL